MNQSTFLLEEDESADMSDPIQPLAPGLEAVAPAAPAAALTRSGAAPAAMEKAAKDFESVFLNTLLQEMGKTVGQSGLLNGAMTEQVQGIVWFYLSQDVASRGGMGLWKELLHHLPAARNVPKAPSGSESNR